jgi:predicted ABC-type transport system involved in lysophospholipase L1 biosynthesis ATPase subunit
LNIIGGIDKPTKGRIIVFGEDLNVKDEDFKQCRFPDSAKSSQFLENPTHFHLIFHSDAGFWSQTGFEFDEG